MVDNFGLADQMELVDLVRLSVTFIPPMFGIASRYVKAIRKSADFHITCKYNYFS